MATLPVLQLNALSAGNMELNDLIINTPYRPFIIKDAIVHYRAHVRQGTHSTKERGEVAGSTRKPWKQKGTGRARAGSVKSPLWRHGGIVFGPKPRDYSIKINKKIRKKALQSALAEKLRARQVVVLDNLKLENHKTKAFQQSLSKLGCSIALIVVDEISKELELASRNLPRIKVITHHSFNVYDLLKYERIIFVKTALIAIEQRLLS